MPDEPLAYFITWTTYGSWLPGDERGWVDARRPGIHAGDDELHDRMEHSLRYDPVVLTTPQRRVVDAAICDRVNFRGWQLHARNVRTNHVHVVISAYLAPDAVRDQLKSWCARKLNEAFGKQEAWWTRKGSCRWLWTADQLEAAVYYVNECQ